MTYEYIMKYKPVVEEEFFTSNDIAIGKNTNAMIAIDHPDLSVAVRIVGMIGKTNFISLSGSIDHKFCKSKNNTIIIQFKQNNI